MKFVDPSGHDPICTIYLDGECAKMSDNRPVSLNYRKPSLPNDWFEAVKGSPKPNDPRFTDWTTLPVGIDDNSWDIKRAEIIWNYLCNLGAGCPSLLDLVTIIATQECSECLNQDIYDNGNGAQGFNALVKLALSLFQDGITAKDLATFTSFFNPEIDGPNFSNKDWNTLLTKPSDTAYGEVKRFWLENASPLTVNGEEITRNWTPTENFAYKQVFDVYWPDTGNVILHFGHPY